MGMTDTLAVVWLIIVGAVLLYGLIRYTDRNVWYGVALGFGGILLFIITDAAIGTLLHG
jgi:hypothetical protein